MVTLQVLREGARESLEKKVMMKDDVIMECRGSRQGLQARGGRGQVEVGLFRLPDRKL